MMSLHLRSVWRSSSLSPVVSSLSSKSFSSAPTSTAVYSVINIKNEFRDWDSVAVIITGSELTTEKEWGDVNAQKSFRVSKWSVLLDWWRGSVNSCDILTAQSDQSLDQVSAAITPLLQDTTAKNISSPHLCLVSVPSKNVLRPHRFSPLYFHKADAGKKMSASNNAHGWFCLDIRKQWL